MEAVKQSEEAPLFSLKMGRSSQENELYRNNGKKNFFFAPTKSFLLYTRIALSGKQNKPTQSMFNGSIVQLSNKKETFRTNSKLN